MNIQDIDKFCDIYEAELREGANVGVEEFLEANQLPSEQELLRELNQIHDEYQGRQSGIQSIEMTATSAFVNDGREARFTDLKPFKKGGLGEVLKATDTELNRVVALKRLKDSHANDPLSQRRFLLEAEVTARLEHPGVVPVHGLFRDELDRTCYAMRMIEGQTLAEAIKTYHTNQPDPVAFRRLLQSFINVCQTVAYAHSRGVIHRDLKPHNIMLGKFNETIVVDWGLAKVVGRSEDEGLISPDITLRPVTESSGETQMGSALGTPAYMSPEQAAGRWDVIDHSSDVFNLGAVLYNLLTGQPPHKGENWPQMQQNIQRGEFPKPRSLASSTSPALEAVCLKAMELNPDDRYASARALASEVERWLADEPVKAYSEPTLTRFNRWTRRHKFMVATTLGVLMTVATLIVSYWKLELEGAKVEIAELNNRLQRSVATTNSHTHGKMMRRTYDFEDAVAATLNQMTAQLSHDKQLNTLENSNSRNELLATAIQFWDRAIVIDVKNTGTEIPGFRTAAYRRNRALCEARIGAHESAFEEVNRLANEERYFNGRTAYELARICAVCASSVPESDTLFQTYVARGDELLGNSMERKFFVEAKIKPGGITKKMKLERDQDFEPLRSTNAYSRLFQKQSEKQTSVRQGNRIL